jgi:hypothetical protein
VLQDKNKYQARLKAQKVELARSETLSTTTESDVGAALDLDNPQDANKSLSRRSSARSFRSTRPPRSPQPGAQLDALQASLEAEIAKSTDESDSSPQSITQPPPVLNFDQPSPHPPSNKGKRPSPLNLTPNRTRSNEAMPRSAFLAPRSGSPDYGGGLRSPMRQPPPSAPPFQTSASMNNLSATFHTPPQRSPGLPASPRPLTPRPLTPNFQSAFPSSGKVIYAEKLPPEQLPQEQLPQERPPPTPRTSKPPTENEYMSDSTSSPTTPSHPTSPRDVLVETSRKSPLVPRRSRMPSHRSSNSVTRTSTSSSILTINGPGATRATRSMSVESKEPNKLIPDAMMERRKSRSFDDLNSYLNKEELPTINDEPLTSNSLLKGIGLDEAIEEMQRESEKYQASPRDSREPISPVAEPPTRAPPAVPAPQPSPLKPAFTHDSRASTSSKPSTLAITPNEIKSIILSVLSVRSRPASIINGDVEDTLFTIRCRIKSTEKPDKEILRVEKTFDAIMDLGANLATIPGMETFLNSFFDAFPSEKSDQRKVCRLLAGLQ